MDVPLLPLRSPRPAGDVVARIRHRGPALVALSGGVDSSLVASLAQEALGPRAVAVTLEGPAVSRAEVERAVRVAATIGIAHHVLPVDPLARPEYRANPSDRCYHCRVVETGALRSFGAGRAIAQYLDGVHVDDLGDDRPGLKAMDEAGFAHPFVWADWGKADVRALARERGLPNWDEPSDACLASRVAHGRAISEPLLRRIEAAEAWLRAEGFRQVRVRTDGDDARIEVAPPEVARLAATAEAERATRALRELGFVRVTIDPRGYRGRGGGPA